MTTDGRTEGRNGGEEGKRTRDARVKRRNQRERERERETERLQALHISIDRPSGHQIGMIKEQGMDTSSRDGVVYRLGLSGAPCLLGGGWGVEGGDAPAAA